MWLGRKEPLLARAEELWAQFYHVVVVAEMVLFLVSLVLQFGFRIIVFVMFPPLWVWELVHGNHI